MLNSFRNFTFPNCNYLLPAITQSGILASDRDIITHNVRTVIPKGFMLKKTAKHGKITLYREHNTIYFLCNGVIVMKQRRFFIVILLVFLLLTGCNLSGGKVSANNERLQELGQEFIDDISNHYLSRVSAPAELSRIGLVTSTTNGSYNVGLLQTFAEQQQKGENCTITMAFTATSTVFSRVVYEDDTGYYLRYQHDDKAENEEMLEITSRYYETTQFIVNDSATKVDLKLFAGKTEIATFAFKNIVTSIDANEV